MRPEVWCSWQSHLAECMHDCGSNLDSELPLSAEPLGMGLCAVLAAVAQRNGVENFEATLLVGVRRPSLFLQFGV